MLVLTPGARDRWIMVAGPGKTTFLQGLLAAAPESTFDDTEDIGGLRSGPSAAKWRERRLIETFGEKRNKPPTVLSSTWENPALSGKTETSLTVAQAETGIFNLDEDGRGCIDPVMIAYGAQRGIGYSDPPGLDMLGGFPPPKTTLAKWEYLALKKTLRAQEAYDVLLELDAAVRGNVPWEQAGLGLQMMGALLFDVAHHLLYAQFPEPDKIWARPSLMESAVMALDEVELHLSKSELRKLHGLMDRFFPEVQVFGTTASPHCLELADCGAFLSDDGALPLDEGIRRLS